MKDIRMMYLGIAVWPSWEVAAKKMWIWLRSVERQGYDFKYYGVGSPQWPGYRAQKVKFQLDYLLKEGWGDATHILYTDCCDCLCLGPPEELVAKYRAMGAPPMLVQASHQLGNVSDPLRYPCFDTPENIAKYGMYRYPSVGGYLMEAPLLVEFLQRLETDYAQYGDDCFAWYDGYADGWFRPEMDSKQEIWQWLSEDVSEYAKDLTGNLRIFNTRTESFPCILHMAGGYASVDNFKDETMLPIARKLGLVKEGEERP